MESMDILRMMFRVGDRNKTQNIMSILLPTTVQHDMFACLLFVGACSIL